MAVKAPIKVRDFADALGMTVSVAGRREFEVSVSDINFPGLQFAGYFRHFANDRVQLAGNAEMSVLADLEEDMVEERMRAFFSYPMPLMVIARGNKAPPIMVEEARKAQVPILRSPLTTTRCSHLIASYLDRTLAPVIVQHGGLVDVYGVGIMFTGESGIGKSETALELVRRGHRLVADDVVELRRVNENRLVGRAPELVRFLMEIRGIGLIDIRHMYGVGAVMLEKSVDIVMELEEWKEGAHYDRLGLDESHTTLLNVKVPHLLTPVRPGRNLAVIVETAARNYRSKRMGYSAAEEFDRRFRAELSEED